MDQAPAKLGSARSSTPRLLPVRGRFRRILPFAGELTRTGCIGARGPVSRAAGPSSRALDRGHRSARRRDLRGVDSVGNGTARVLRSQHGIGGGLRGGASPSAGQSPNAARAVRVRTSRPVVSSRRGFPRGRRRKYHRQPSIAGRNRSGSSRRRRDEAYDPPRCPCRLPCRRDISRANDRDQVERADHGDNRRSRSERVARGSSCLARACSGILRTEGPDRRSLLHT